MLIGSLRYQGSEGDETSLKKINSRSLNLHRNYSNLLTLSNVGELSWSWIPKNHIQVRKKKEILSSLVHVYPPPQNMKLDIFTSSSRSDDKEMLKVCCTCIGVEFV